MKVLFVLPGTALALVLGGCDPGWDVDGTVVRPNGDAASGATVTLECPSGRKETATTDAQGHFSFGGVAGAEESGRCSVVIAAVGFTERRLRATDVCHRSTERGNYGQTCDPAKGRVVLSPSAVTAASGAPAAPTSPSAGAADGGSTAAAPDGGALGPYEPTGEPLPLPGLALPAAGARPYTPLGLPWAALSALLDATPGLRVRDHVGFYPPRPIDLTGRPAPYTFGHVNALSRPGTWRPAPDATFVLVPYHHTEPSLAFYVPSGDGTVRFVTKVESVPCEEADHELGFVLTRRADELQVIRTCGAQAEVTTYGAQGGKLAARVEHLDAAAVRPGAGD